MIDPTFGRELQRGSRFQTLRSTLSFQVSRILTANQQQSLGAVVGVGVDDADDGCPETCDRPLPALSQDRPLSGQVTGGGNCWTENGKRANKGQHPNDLFLYLGVFGMRSTLLLPPRIGLTINRLCVLTNFCAKKEK